MERTEELLAYHEAGHAVVGKALGCQITPLSYIRN
jgi:hypothetical protein